MTINKNKKKKLLILTSKQCTDVPIATNITAKYTKSKLLSI